MKYEFLLSNTGVCVLELFFYHRFINRVSIVVFSLYVVLVTMVVMVLWLPVTCITLVISPWSATQSVPPSLFMPG